MPPCLSTTTIEVKLHMLTEQKRWFYVALPVFFFWFFGQIDKLSISIIQTDPQFLQDLGLTGPNKNALVGLLTLIFTIAYSVSNIFWGVIIDKLGARKTAIIGLSVWTVTMVAGGMAQSYEMFMLSRIILGLGEGMIIPVSAKFISNWFNSREIGRAQASWIIGNYLGPAIGALILTYLITTYSWHESFYVLASFTLFISLPLFMFLARNTPEEHPGVSQKELAHIRLADTTARTSEEKKSFLTNYRYWIVFFGNLMSSFIFFGISIWLPTYLVEAKHFSRESMAGITSLSWMFALCFVILGGFLADKKKRPGLLASIWFILCVLFLTSAYFATNPLIAGVSLGIAHGYAGRHVPFSKPVCREIFHERDCRESSWYYGLHQYFRWLLQLHHGLDERYVRWRFYTYDHAAHRNCRSWVHCLRDYLKKRIGRNPQFPRVNSEWIETSEKI